MWQLLSEHVSGDSLRNAPSGGKRVQHKRPLRSEAHSRFGKQTSDTSAMTSCGVQKIREEPAFLSASLITSPQLKRWTCERQLFGFLRRELQKFSCPKDNHYNTFSDWLSLHWGPWSLTDALICRVFCFIWAKNHEHVSAVFAHIDPPGYFAEHIARTATDEYKDPDKYGLTLVENSSTTAPIITIVITNFPEWNAATWSRLITFAEPRWANSFLPEAA